MSPDRKIGPAGAARNLALKIGLIGAPNSGKLTFLSALTTAFVSRGAPKGWVVNPERDALAFDESAKEILALQSFPSRAEVENSEKLWLRFGFSWEKKGEASRTFAVEILNRPGQAFSRRSPEGKAVAEELARCTWPRWLIVAGAVLLIVAAALFVRWIRNQRRMSGYLCLLVAYGGDDGIRQERLGPYELARHRDLDIHFDRPTRQELGRTATATTEKAQAKVSRTPGLRRSQRGLIVTYSADGSPATPQKVPYNDHFLIHGVDFIHHDHSHDTDVTSCDAPVESESR